MGEEGERKTHTHIPLDDTTLITAEEKLQALNVKYVVSWAIQILNVGKELIFNVKYVIFFSLFW